MINFSKDQLDYVVSEIETLRGYVTDPDEPAYCLLTHALEDVLLIAEFFEL